MKKEELKENIKLAAFDIDGTILPYAQPEFSNNIELMFKKLEESNIKLALATAREFVTIGKLMNKASNLDYFIGANGAFVYDCKHKDLIFERTIKFEDFKILYEFFNKYITCEGFTIMDRNYGWYSPKMNINTWFLSPHQAKMKPVDYDAVEKDHLHVITITAKDIKSTNDCAKKAKELIEKYNMDLEVNSQWATGVFVSPKGITKSHTLDWLAKYLKLDSKKNLIAFGDSSNDYEMIRDAAYGVTMEKASEYLKAVANDVALDPTSDGAYFKLKELDLIK